MSPASYPRATLQTLHQDLGAVRGELRGVKELLATGLRSFPPAWSGEVLRTLRDSNRLGEERFAQLDVTLREQAIETHTIVRAVAAGQGQLVETQRQLVETQRHLLAELRALIARIDALIRGRGDGAPAG